MRNERSQSPDYYRILGISPDASQGEVREAYRAAAKRWHPDVNPGAEAAERMREVNEAWRVLGDATIRAGYDGRYRQARPSSAAASSTEGPGRQPTSSAWTGTVNGIRLRSVFAVGGMLIVAAMLGGIVASVFSGMFSDAPVARELPAKEILVITRVATPTPVPASSATPTATPTPTQTPTPTSTATPTPSLTPTATQTAQHNPTATRMTFPTPFPSPTPIWGVYQRSGYNVKLRQNLDGLIGCSPNARVSANIGEGGSDFFQGRVEFDFLVPTAEVWSIGIVYHKHAARNHDSAAILARNANGTISVGHWTRSDWEELSRASETIWRQPGFRGFGFGTPRPTPTPQPGLGASTPGRTVRFGFVSDSRGSRVLIDGKQVLSIRPYQLRPISSSLQICAGFYTGEPERYSIDVSRFRAGYTRSAVQSTAIARPNPTPTR